MARKKRRQQAEDASEAPDGAVDGPGTAKPTPDKPKSALRGGLDFFVMLCCAVLAALIIKATAFDIYLIPSGSMETALHGRPDGGDRILCSKVSYHFRAPKRWEVAVFEFPYESARQHDYFNISEVYKGQNFVKRIVGLPGETLAIRKGDIWVRAGSAGEFQRVVKPDSVQRGMWLKVYRQDFQDIALPELESFWRIAGGDASLRRGGPLRLSGAEEAVRMTYRALVPAGPKRNVMAELPGVPDRYALEQPVQFRCNATNEAGETCGQHYMRSFRSQNIEARCPRCGSLQNETSAVFYHRRSGLPVVGRYAVGHDSAPQGEDVAARSTDYHVVPDLRIVVDAVLESDDTALTLSLREDSRFVQAVLMGNGQAEIRVNGRPSAIEARALSGIRPGKRHRIEFYVIEGVARLFLDDAGQAVIETAAWKDRMPQIRDLPRSSGVELVVAGGEAALSSLAIDRDIFYYSGRERDGGEKFMPMGVNGDIVIGADAFFPMGDHCPSSYDARSWGPVPLSLLRGPALAIWWPPDRMSAIAKP